MKPDTWVVGKSVPLDRGEGTGTEFTWEFMGVFDSEEKAKAACLSEDCFVGPAFMNLALPLETAPEWPGLYYPQANAAKESDGGNERTASAE